MVGETKQWGKSESKPSKQVWGRGKKEKAEREREWDRHFGWSILPYVIMNPSPHRFRSKTSVINIFIPREECWTVDEIIMRQQQLLIYLEDTKKTSWRQFSLKKNANYVSLHWHRNDRFFKNWQHAWWKTTTKKVVLFWKCFCSTQLLACWTLWRCPTWGGRLVLCN